MDDLRRRFATLDALPTPVDWAEVERRAASVGSQAVTPASVPATSVRRGPGSLVRPAATRPRGLALVVAVALIAALVAGVIGFGGLLNRHTIVDVSPSPTADTTANPTSSPSIATSPSPAAAACPPVDAPTELRITEFALPGKTTAPLGPPLVTGCALWVTSGQNGGGIHRIDIATGAVTNANPVEVPFDIAADGEELWAIGQPKPADAAGHPALYQLDPATGATIRELPLSTFGSELTILDGRAWIGDYHSPLEIIDLASGELVASVEVAGDIQVGAGGVWSGLTRIDPVTFEVTQLQTSIEASDVVIVGERMYGFDRRRSQLVQIDPVTGVVLTSVDVGNGLMFAAERDSIWVLQFSEPEGTQLKLRTTNLLRVNVATGQITDRFPIEVVSPIAFSATEGNLWLVDQPSRLRHGFIRFEVPASLP